MRKKIATLILAFAFILPCAMFFTACGKSEDDKAKVTSISVELVNSDYTLTDNTITIPYGNKVELDADDFKVTAKLSDGTNKEIKQKTDSVDGFVFESTIPDDEITPIDDYTISFSHSQLKDKFYITVNVVKAVVDMSEVEWDYSEPFTYDGTEKEVKLTGLPQGVSVVYSHAKATDAATYEAVANFSYIDTEHYESIPSKTLTWEIKKADIVVNSVTTQSFVFEEGVERTAAITSAKPVGVKSINISGETKATNAGTYNIVVSFDLDDEDNYNPIDPISTTWTISPAAFEVKGNAKLKDEFKNLTYKGSNYTIDLDLSEFDSNNIKATIEPSTITAKNANTYYARVNLEYIGTNKNYNRLDKDFVTVEWEIKKAELTVTAKPYAITYGEEPNNNGVDYAGFVAKETKDVLGGLLAFDYNYEAGNNAGGNYTITPKGLTSNNYDINFVSGVLSVNKKALMIKVNDVTIDYNTEATNNGVQPIGLIPADTIVKVGTFEFNFGGYTKGSNVGTYEITIRGDKQTNSTLDETNYDITIEKGTLTVEKIDVNVDTTGIALKTNTFVYDGTNVESKLEVINLPKDVTCTNIVVRDKTAVNVDGYVAVIYLKYADTTNYNPMSEIIREFIITKATVSSFDEVELSVNSVVYKGSQYTVEILNIPNGAKIKTIEGNTGTDVGTYTINVAFECSDKANYVDFGIVNKEYTWTITQAPLTIAAKDNTIAYLDAAANNGINEPTGFVGTDDITVLEGILDFDYSYTVGDVVGENYTITPKGLTSKNYKITYVAGKLIVEKAKINFAEVNWIKNSPYTYNKNSIEPVLNYSENDIVNIEYTYSKVGGGNERPINVGNYIAIASIELMNSNYEIINNNVEDFEYTIVAKKINVSSLIWDTEDSVVFTGKTILPEISSLIEGLKVDEYIYLLGEEVVEPINVGIYTVHAELSTISDNYEIEGAFEDLSFEVIAKEVDCSALAWTETVEFTYNNTVFRPELKELHEGVKSTYHYTTKEGVECLEPKAAGEYIAYVTISAINPNYSIINYTQLDSLDFKILKAEIDITELAWNTTETEFVYNNELIKPVLNKTNIDGVLTFNYTYTSSSGFVSGVVEPRNVGEYIARAEFVYDAENYILIKNNEVTLQNVMLYEYSIVCATATLGEVDWNIDTTLISKYESSEDHSATIEYVGAPININIIGNLDMFKVEYSLDGYIVETISISSAKNYDISATITLKDEYEQNYNYFYYSMMLSLQVATNPFESIKVDDVDITFEELKAATAFEYGSIITFELKDGYVACANGVETTQFVVGTNQNMEVRDTNDYLTFSKYIDFYYFDEIVVGSKSVIENSQYNIFYRLSKGQTEFSIDFDSKYLTKYKNLINYTISDYDKTQTSGVITSVPFAINNAENVSNVCIYFGEEHDRDIILDIQVQQYSPIKEINCTIVSLKNDETEALDLTQTSLLYLRNQIITDFSVVLEDEFKDCTVKCYYENTKTEVDFSDLDSLTSFYVIAFDGEVEIDRKYIHVDFEISTKYYYFDENTNVFNLEQPEFDITFESFNPKVKVSSTVDGKSILTLTENVTNVTYILSAVYNDKTYTFSKNIAIVYSERIEIFAATETTITLTYPTLDQVNSQTAVYGNSISLNSYDAATIKDLNLKELEFVGISEDYTIDKIELVSINGKAYLKLTISEVEQSAGVASVQTAEDVTYVYIMLEIQGEYSDNTSAAIRVVDYSGTETIISNDTSEFDVDISTQLIQVSLNNRYATAVISDGENVLATSNNGYIQPFVFSGNGTYYLIITATDGTQKTYTIKVVGEYVPVLEVKVGEYTLSQQVTVGGPSVGDFVWEVLNPNGTEMRFSKDLGVDGRSLFVPNEETRKPEVTIISLRSSMMGDAQIFDNYGNEISTLSNFVLEVQDVETRPYVMFYAETEEGVKTYIYLYFGYMESTEPEIPETVVEAVYNGTSYSLSSKMTTVGFEIESMNESDYGMEMMLVAYLGKFDSTPSTIKLDSISSMYDDMATITDLMSETQKTITNTTNVELTVATIPGDTVPLAGYSISLTQTMSGEQGQPVEIDMVIDVIFYLIDKSDVAYPAVISIGQNDYNFKFSSNSFAFGDVIMDENCYSFYINETSANVQDITEITITLSRAYDDFSYMVLIGDAYDGYMTNVEMAGVKDPSYINTLLSATENKKAFKATEDNLTMTIPITFVDGVAYFDIAAEGFEGYIADSNEDMTFNRLYILVDGAKLPADDGGEEGYPGDGYGTTEEILHVVANGRTLTQAIKIGSMPISYEGSFEVVSNGDSGYFVGYIGSTAFVEGQTTYTIDMIQITEFASEFYETVWITDQFNSNSPITLTNNQATGVILTVGMHNGHNCVAFTLDDSSIVYLYMEDVPSGENPDDPNNGGSGGEELEPSQTLEVSVTIGMDEYITTDFQYDQDMKCYYICIGKDYENSETLKINSLIVKGANAGYDAMVELEPVEIIMQEGCAEEFVLTVSEIDKRKCAGIVTDNGFALIFYFEDAEQL